MKEETRNHPDLTVYLDQIRGDTIEEYVQRVRNYSDKNAQRRAVLIDYFGALNHPNGPDLANKLRAIGPALGIEDGSFRSLDALNSGVENGSRYLGIMDILRLGATIRRRQEIPCIPTISTEYPPAYIGATMNRGQETPGYHQP